MSYDFMPSSDKAKASRGKYPWSELPVGQSFAVPFGNVNETTLVSLAFRAGKKLGRKFKVVEHLDAKVFEVARLADPIQDNKNQLGQAIPGLRGFQPMPVNPKPADNDNPSDEPPRWAGMTAEEIKGKD